MSPLNNTSAPAELDNPAIPSPCFVVDRRRLATNLDILDRVQQASGAKIILALKGFAMFSLFDQIRETLHGTTASSLNEALLGHHEFGKELHTYCVAYRDDEFDEIAGLSHHVVFNSLSQWERYKGRMPDGVKAGLRINPEVNEAHTELYNPCCAHSRLGVRSNKLIDVDLTGISGFHFHALCGNNSDALQRALTKVEKLYGPYLNNLEWINFGGGHHITREDYDVDTLITLCCHMRDTYGVQVYIEPGEAVALNTGFLVASVLDIVDNDMPIALLDTSASAHMPDVLEMPYRPEIIHGAEPGVKPHTYRLGGLTCLAGDIIGDYSFDQPLAIGDRLIFTDMGHYSMVKTTTFNGVNLPDIGILERDGTFTHVKQFGYENYKRRLS